MRQKLKKTKRIGGTSCGHSANSNASAGDDCSMEEGWMNHPQKGVFIHYM